MKKNLIKRLLLASTFFTIILTPSCVGGGTSSVDSSSSVSSEDVSSVDPTIPNDYVNYEGNVISIMREVKPLTGPGWKFKRLDIPEAKNKDYNDKGWDKVSIPHTWNNLDAQDGGGNYARTKSWYRKTITLSNQDLANKKHYLEFFGVNMQCEVFVNGQSVGIHKGGYTAFRFDVTDKLIAGENLIAVTVSNVKTQDIAPLSADFNFYGGIYREVNLVSVPEVHVDMMDYGSSGLYLMTTDVSEESATLTIKSNIVNDSDKAKTVTVKATLKEPETFEEVEYVENLDFDINDMISGEIIEIVSENVTIPANDKYNFNKVITVDNPKLWNGRSYPFRYQVVLEIIENDKTIDDVSSYIGFRYFEVTKEGGFFLNGKSYPLRGVSRHQDWKNKGNAISKKEHDIDFGYIYELGVSSIRLAHYPHSNYFYELCDRYGLVVWAEIPFVNHVGSSANFLDVTKNQLIELIRQQYNRASICIWGLQNEVELSYNTYMLHIMKILNDTAHQEDPTRLTAQATHHSGARYWDADLLAWNTYPGWYSGTTIKANMDDYQNNYHMPVGISEYGYGGNVNQHEEYPYRGTTGVFPEGQWHPVEYQNLQHELAVKEVTDPNRNGIWCAYIWNMFDFASDYRNEGSQPGMNDKGLITYDRSIKKDVFYLYKANWNQKDKFVHLTSKDYTSRQVSSTYVKAYSNLNKLVLYVNGKLISELENDGNGIFKWDDVNLRTGPNEILIKALDEGYTHLQDGATWVKAVSNNTLIKSDTVAIDATNKTILFKNGLLVTDLLSTITSNYGATFKVYEEDGKTEVTSGLAKPGMKFAVTSEDGSKVDVYTLKIAYLSTNKKVTVSSFETSNMGSNAVDNDPNTRWAASSNAYPQTLIIDLEGTFYLDDITISWFISGDRTYKYRVYVGNENESYIMAVDRTGNNTIGEVKDTLKGYKGRYIKIEVTGSSAASGYASIYEVIVNGWGINSKEYEVDETNKTITLNISEDTINVDDFLKNLGCEGDCDIIINTTGDVIKDKDTITIIDSQDIAHTYTIIIKE